jgi:hypothetical protein
MGWDKVTKDFTAYADPNDEDEVQKLLKIMRRFTGKGKIVVAPDWLWDYELYDDTGNEDAFEDLYGADEVNQMEGKNKKPLDL